MTAEQVAERIANLQNALETGERPEGQRPEGVGRPNGGRPQHGGQDDRSSGNRAARVQAVIDRLQAALENGNLPANVTADQVAERIASLQNALETGERPEGQRPEGVGRSNRGEGRPNGGRPDGAGRPDNAGRHEGTRPNGRRPG